MKVFKFAASAAILAWASAAQAQTTLSMWYHGAGNEVELKLINEVITDFNASQTDWKVELQSFPQAAYNDSVVAGALAGNLPDILDVDGPNMPNWAWAGYMQPLKIDESKIANFLPGTKGTWDGQLYSVSSLHTPLSLSKKPWLFGVLRPPSVPSMARNSSTSALRLSSWRRPCGLAQARRPMLQTLQSFSSTPRPLPGSNALKC